MPMTRRERREKGLLFYQLAMRLMRLRREGVDIFNMDSRELAAALTADMKEDGLLRDVDWEEILKLFLKYLPEILELLIKFL